MCVVPWLCSEFERLVAAYEVKLQVRQAPCPSSGLSACLKLSSVPAGSMVKRKADTQI